MTKIKDDYAGYFDKTNDAKFANYVKTVLAHQSNDTFKTLCQLTSFFNDQHLQLYAVDALKDMNVDSIECSKNLKEFRRFYLDRKELKDVHEGYWINEQHTNIIFIKKVFPGRYNAFVVDSKKSRVPNGFAIAEIQQIRGNNFLTYFISPKVGGRLCLRSKFNKSCFITGDVAKWVKLKYPYDQRLLSKSISPTIQPSGMLISPSTYLITVPSFAAQNKSIVDSIVKADSQKITSANNLIIDIRNNTGGTVRTYSSLVPFAYSKPIASVSGYTRCTKDLVAHKQEAIEKYLHESIVDTPILNELKSDLIKIQDNLGSFFFEAGDTFKLDYTNAAPKNVAIITNYACQSAAEMMILDFKQSSKVKTFGEHTM